MRRTDLRRQSVPSEDDIAPPDRQAIRVLVAKLSRLINLGLQTWNEASHYQPFDSDLHYEKVKKLKRQVATLKQENALLKKQLEEAPGGTVWTRNVHYEQERTLRTLFVQPLVEVESELVASIREVEKLVEDDSK